VIAWFLTLRYGGKWIYDTRNFFWDKQVDLGRNRKNLLVRWGFLLDRFLVRKADKVIAVTDAAKRIYIDQLPQSDRTIEKIAVIHNNYAPERFGLNLSQRLARRAELELQDQIVLIYSGSLVRWYLFDDMARFCNKYRTKQPNALTLWCSYEWTDQSKQWASHLLTRDFLLLKLNPKEVGITLQAADVGMMFLEPTLSNATTFPIKFAEYLACGLPVVINAGLEEPEAIVRKYRVGVVVPELSDDGIDRAVDELQELLEDPEVKERAQEAARREFHLEQAIEKYRQCYQTLLS
jgi:glycosyltransferase involved in cell wall biosynthesis